MSDTHTTTVALNSEVAGKLAARQVVEARARLAKAKRLADAAEAAFVETGETAVILEDGTKVAVVTSAPRSLDQDALRDLIPAGQWQRVTRRVATLALIDEAIAAGWLDAEAIAPALSIGERIGVRVTQPKR